jgi:hypothetical protein
MYFGRALNSPADVLSQRHPLGGRITGDDLVSVSLLSRDVRIGMQVVLAARWAGERDGHEGVSSCEHGSSGEISSPVRRAGVN